jgi:hypothetical protein
VIKFTCQHCRKTACKPAGHVNRSRASGMSLYCSRICSGMARRKHISDAQKKLEKRLYDLEYNKRNRDKRQNQKAEYHKRTYDPVRAAEHRKTRMPYHVEYCRGQKYKVKKREYDKKRRASEYGPAAEAYTVFIDLTREIKSRATTYEIKWESGTWGKKQARNREARAESEKASRHRDKAA